LLRRWDAGGAVYSVSFTADGEYLATVSSYGNAYVMDLTTGEEVARLAQGDVVFDAVISPSGRLIATGASGGQVRVWDWRTGENLLRMQHEGGVQGVLERIDSHLNKRFEHWPVALGNREIFCSGEAGVAIHTSLRLRHPIDNWGEPPIAPRVHKRQSTYGQCLPSRLIELFAANRR
jgi:hypothetical protein